MSEIIFIGNARDFHAMDWYRTIKKVCKGRNVIFVTDLIESEGHLNLVGNEDNIINLYNIDWLLFKKQTSMGNVWRNIVKVLASPLQILKIKAIAKKHPSAVYHAHTMYYMFLCWLAELKFIGTPQGDEVLVRPGNSLTYKYFACKSLIAANHIIVDSVNMQIGIKKLCDKTAVIIQNGIDISSIMAKLSNKKIERSGVFSFRAMYPNYRIDKILTGREKSKLKPSLSFSYPFWEETYKRMILSRMEPCDLDLGRLPDKGDVHELLSAALLAISIPESDSSPRSVYEAIFCGCCVAVTYNTWIESVPSCMRSRLFIVDLEDDGWLDKAIEFAQLITKAPYIPSQRAFDLFDQKTTMKRVADLFYNS